MLAKIINFIMRFLRRPKPSPTDMHEHIFNDDLLINEKRDRGKTDLEWATEQFPEIIHLLDYRKLREKFKFYEEEANNARDWVRSLGFAAVVSAAVALLAVATEPIRPSFRWSPILALALEIGGLLGSLIAVGGLWIWPWKSRWLHARMMTERIRQWHFQLMVRRQSDVEASLQPGGRKKFEEQRDIWFDNFLNSYEGRLDAKLRSLTGQNSQSETWLHDVSGGYGKNTVYLGTIFEAFRRLRFDHQVVYADYKLRTERQEPFYLFLKWPAIHQMKVLSGAANFCFVCAAICSVVLIYNYATDTFAPAHTGSASHGIQHYIRTAAVAIALCGAAFRTLQDGLAPDKEIERYEDYRSRTSQLRDRFITAKNDPKERLHLMEELELATVDEMKGFLRTHHNATFVLA